MGLLFDGFTGRVWDAWGARVQEAQRQADVAATAASSERVIEVPLSPAILRDAVQVGFPTVAVETLDVPAQGEVE